MKSEIKYELPIFSSNLEQDPVIESKDMNMEIELIGMDEENRLRKIVKLAEELKLKNNEQDKQESNQE